MQPMGQRWSRSCSYQLLKLARINYTLVHLDTSLLGESLGPNSQEGLRKVWKPDEALIQKLLRSTLVGLGAQTRMASAIALEKVF